MATKNLSRTIIEGGRRKGNKEDRRRSIRAERLSSREFCRAASLDAEIADERQPVLRRHVGKDFDDKLSAIYQWMESHVGSAWNDVYSKVRSSFDVRTTAGRHIVFDHLLGSVQRPGERYTGGKFMVDDEGILQLNPDSYWTRRNKYRDEWLAEFGPPPEGGWKTYKSARVHAWAGDNLVRDYGAVQFWMVPRDMVWAQCPKPWSCSKSHRTVRTERRVPDVEALMTNGRLRRYINVRHDVDSMGRPVLYRIYEVEMCRQVSGGYCQGVQLSDKQAEFWRTLHPRNRQWVTWKKEIHNRFYGW